MSVFWLCIQRKIFRSSQLMYFITILAASLPLSVRAQYQSNSDERLTHEKLVEIIDSKSVKSLEELLVYLPDIYRTNYVLMYSSRSLQPATKDAPRVISYGKDAKFIMAFGGDGKSLETMEFNEETKRFELRRFLFPGKDSSNQKVTVSPKNPPLCLSCHKQNPRPNWESYFIWPGAYGSQDDETYRKYPQGGEGYSEFSWYKSFVNGNQKKGIYASLKAQNHEYPYYGLPKWEAGDKLNTSHLETKGSGSNQKFGFLLSYLNLQRVARIISEDKKLQPFRYAIVGSLFCDYLSGETNFEFNHLPMEDFLPNDLKNALDFKRSFPATRNDTIEKMTDEMYQNLKLLQDLSPGFEDRTKNSFMDLENSSGTWTVNKKYVYGKAIGNDDVVTSISKLRYLIEGAGSTTDEWATGLNNSYSFTDGLNQIDTRLTILLIEELLKNEQDPTLKGAFRFLLEAPLDHSVRSGAITVNFSSSSSPIPTETRKKVCEVLKRKSLEMLTPIASHGASIPDKAIAHGKLKDLNPIGINPH